MIRVRENGDERELSFEQFVQAIQEGRVHADTPVASDVLTAGVWKKAGELQFFRSWAPKGAVPEREPEREPEPETAPEPEPEPEPAEGPEREPQPTAEREEPSSPAETADGPIPWEMADRLGVVPRAIWTVALAFREAEEFFRRISNGRSVTPALTFGLLIYAIASLIEAIYGALLWAGLGESVQEFIASMPGADPNAEMPTIGDIFSSHGLAILFYPLFAFLWSWVVHLFLRMFGNPARGFNDTFRIVNYSITPLLLTVIPICGNLIGWVWVVVLSVRGLIRNQEVEGSSALLSVLIPFILIVGIYLFLAVRALPGMGTSG